MKKFLPLVIFLFAAVLFSSCQDSFFPVKEVSSIKIVLPGKNISSREAETAKTESGDVIQSNSELQFIFTVSDEEGEKVSLKGKSGDTLVAEVEPGIYSVSLKGYSLEDTDFEKPYCESSQDKVLVIAGEVTKVVLELKLVEIAEPDPSEISFTITVSEITLPETLEISVNVDGKILESPYIINKGSVVNASVMLPETVVITDTEFKWTLDDYPFEDDLEDGNSISFDSSRYGKLGVQNFTVTVIDQNGKEYINSINLIFTGDDN